MQDETDYDLLAAWRRGDRKRGNVLFHRHATSVTRFFRNKVAVGAEDLAQKTFLALVEGRDRFEGRATFRTFLFAVARKQLLLHLRSTMRERHRLDPQRWSVVDASTTPPRVTAKMQQRELIDATLQRLPLDYQIALELHYWKGLSVSEIAGVLGEAEGTVKSRLSRGRGMLRDKLVKQVDQSELLASAIDVVDRWSRGMPGTVLSSGET